MSIRLTTSSYVVLSLVAQLQPATAYDLKRLAHSTVFNFWSLPHTVLYTETQRLCDAEYLQAEQEEGGRRRRRFSLTTAGSDVLEQWRAEPTDEFLELRDPGLLRLFAGAEPQALAVRQLERHRAQLRAYLDLDEALASSPGDQGPVRSTLAAGIAIEREYVRFWTTLADRGSTTSAELGPP